MLKKVVISALLLISFVASAEECNNKCQERRVEEYFDLLSEVYRKGSKESDIEALFGLFSSDVSYEHLNYQASFNREEWKSAFLNNHRRGAYKSASNQFIKVETYIHGKGYVAVSYSYVFKSKNGSLLPKGDQKLLALFGITHGKISSVKEYW